MPIEDIEVGDRVLGEDAQTGEQGYFEVVAITNHPTDEVLAVTVESVDEDGEDEGQSSQTTTHDVMQVTLEHPIYVEGEGWLLAENLELGERLRRADGGMAKVLAIDRLELDEPQPVYNFTVKGPHTYFVLDAGVLVHNSSCAQWVDDILRQRRIDKPEGVELNTDAIELVRNEVEARLSGISDLHARNVALKRFNQGTAAILEVDGRWYHGLNAQLDEVVASNVVGGVVQTRFRVTGRPRLKVSDKHAETHAIIEYWDALGRNPNPASGKMVVSRQPCRSCLRDYVPGVSYSPYEGNIAYVGQAANLEAINVSYVESNGDRAVSNPLMILPSKAQQIGGIYP